MFKKNKKQTETLKEPKEKKVRTVKVGTHKKTVIALWVVLIASVSFGVYKNFTLSTSTRPMKKKSLNFACRTPTG
jgi:hypothetical protein